MCSQNQDIRKDVLKKKDLEEGCLFCTPSHYEIRFHDTTHSTHQRRDLVVLDVAPL